MINYRSERDHDVLLIKLVRDLDRRGRLDLLENAFSIDESLGKLERAQHRQPFDVELTFENLSIAVESKVDSDEGGRWGSKPEWQTDRIVSESEKLWYLKSNKRFRYITYGSSEFYTKPHCAGPASPEFKHIALDDMIDFVATTDEVLESCKERREWLRLMRIEKTKRSKSVELLQRFSRFRRHYLDIHEDNDFPRNRFVFCAPELAFPTLSLLKRAWHESEYAERYGRLSLYDVGRGGPGSPPVHDSILNFWEMWHSFPEERALGNALSDIGAFYLEINEDFNLNLKCGSRKEITSDQKEEVWKRLRPILFPPGCDGRCRNYVQDVVVLYEIDFGFLDHLDDMAKVVSNLGETVSAIVKALS